MEVYIIHFLISNYNNELIQKGKVTIETIHIILIIKIISCQIDLQTDLFVPQIKIKSIYTTGTLKLVIYLVI